VLRSVLDDRTEAERYGGDCLAHFGPLWRSVSEAAESPLPSASLLAIASRILELAALTQPWPADGAAVVTMDGRTLALPPRPRDRTWLLAVAVPQLLQRTGITMRVIPSLVLLPKFLPPTPNALADAMQSNLRRAVEAGLRDLDRIERQISRLHEREGLTKRSKSPLLARLNLAYPGLTPKAVARLLDVTPQGARKLLASASTGQRLRT